MKYATILIFSLMAFLLGNTDSAQAFSMSGQNFALGEPILIFNANPDYLYSIFWINGSNPNEEACNYIYGHELTGYFAVDLDGVSQWVEGDNDLTHYGTCFVNDPGTFKIVELSDQGFAANYLDSQQSEFFVSKDTIVMR